MEGDGVARRAIPAPRSAAWRIPNGSGEVIPITVFCSHQQFWPTNECPQRRRIGRIPLTAHDTFRITTRTTHCSPPPTATWRHHVRAVRYEARSKTHCRACGAARRAATTLRRSVRRLPPRQVFSPMHAE